MRARLTGRLLGIPYDWRVPTAARMKARWWNPEDRRVLTTKVFGWGWTINLYQLLRWLGLLRRS